MSAPTEPLKPTLEEAREMARLRRRIADLEDQLAAARRTVGQQQDEFQASRPRLIRQPRPVVRDVPTGEAL